MSGLIKDIKMKENTGDGGDNTPSENGSAKSSSSGCGGGGGGNNSDNSAIISLGNTSFGFNFESDGGFNNSSGSGSGSNSEEGGNSDQGGDSGSDQGDNNNNNNNNNNRRSSKSTKAIVKKGREGIKNNRNKNNPNNKKVTDSSSTSSRTKTSSGVMMEGQTQEASSKQDQDDDDQEQLPQQELPSTSTGPVVDVKSSSATMTVVTVGGTGSDSNTMTAGETAAKISSGGGSMKPPLPQSVGSTATTAGVPIASSSSYASLSGYVSSITASSTQSQSVGVGASGGGGIFSSSHTDAAAAAVANLNSIATAATKKIKAENYDAETRGLKRKANNNSAADDDDSGGYNSDDDEGGTVSSKTTDASTLKNTTTTTSNTTGSTIGNEEMNMDDDDDESIMSGGGGGNKKGGKKKKLDESKREERNAREKERSFRISRQINELRNLLSSGGVIVPKGTKSSVLTEAANYIRMLQQHQYRSEIDRHQLVQQVQRIGSGALGQQAASAVRHVAAQNGVWSLGNFGGVPPKSAMMYHQPSGPIADEPTSSPDSASSLNGSTLPSKIEESDYRQVFNSCTIGMAIASMGGAFIDCNKLFCNISNYTKQEICSMTVFNLTSRQDLQSAFDLISQMLSAPIDPTVTNTSCVLRGALKSRTDIGLNVKLIKGGDGVAKCFCVTLIMNPASPYDTSKPTPATMGHGIANTGQILPGPTAKGSSQAGLAPSPAYTTG